MVWSFFSTDYKITKVLVVWGNDCGHLTAMKAVWTVGILVTVVFEFTVHWGYYSLCPIGFSSAGLSLLLFVAEELDIVLYAVEFESTCTKANIFQYTSCARLGKVKRSSRTFIHIFHANLIFISTVCISFTSRPKNWRSIKFRPYYTRGTEGWLKYGKDDEQMFYLV